MTMHSGCCALYLSCLGLPTASGSPGVSGPEPPLGSASTGPEICVSDSSELVDSHEGGEQHHVDTNTSNGLGVDLPGLLETPGHVPVNTTPFVEHFPSILAGAPISDMGQSVLGLQGRLHTENIWFPFQSKHDWEFVQWSKKPRARLNCSH
ncbi:hypothetical protein V8E53_014177 [Lactarius tabidus]